MTFAHQSVPPAGSQKAPPPLQISGLAESAPAPDKPQGLEFRIRNTPNRDVSIQSAAMMMTTTVSSR